MERSDTVTVINQMCYLEFLKDIRSAGATRVLIKMPQGMTPIAHSPVKISRFLKNMLGDEYKAVKRYGEFSWEISILELNKRLCSDRYDQNLFGFLLNQVNKRASRNIIDLNLYGSPSGVFVIAEKINVFKTRWFYKDIIYTYNKNWIEQAKEYKIRTQKMLKLLDTLVIEYRKNKVESIDEKKLRIRNSIRQQLIDSVPF